MPTVLRLGPYRIYFVSHDIVNELSHVHVDREDQSAKFWLSPVALARNLGFNPRELRSIERIIREHHQQLFKGVECLFQTSNQVSG